VSNPERERVIRLRFAFDYVDPGSYLASTILTHWVGSSGRSVAVDWKPLELRVPPASRIDPTDPEWDAMTRHVRDEARGEGVELRPHAPIPWTRKAHELAFHAREKGCFDAVRGALFEAHFTDGRDIGRVDVLVRIGSEHGLEAAETRTVLGTDRFRSVVEADREELLGQGIRGVPTLCVGGVRLEGFATTSVLRDFLNAME
jgi:predicted DsbA family dithiol-disulfide isomerase